MWQRTQNPPPLKACRFDSDLGHHLDSYNVLLGRNAETTVFTAGHRLSRPLRHGCLVGDLTALAWISLSGLIPPRA